MSGGLIPTGDGHTELDEDERHDLIPTYIATRRELFAADLLVVALGGAAFSWGAGLSVSTDELRRSYRGALVEADQGDLSALLTFVRS